MAQAARYGHVQPSEFEGLDWPMALALVKRVRALYKEDVDLNVALVKEHAKATAGSR